MERSNKKGSWSRDAESGGGSSVCCFLTIILKSELTRFSNGIVMRARRGQVGSRLPSSNGQHSKLLLCLEFGNMEDLYRFAEFKAKSQKKGIWGMKGVFESPGAYKRAIRGEAASMASNSANAARAGGGSGATKSGGKGSTLAVPTPTRKKS